MTEDIRKKAADIFVQIYKKRDEHYQPDITGEKQALVAIANSKEKAEGSLSAITQMHYWDGIDFEAYTYLKSRGFDIEESVNAVKDLLQEMTERAIDAEKKWNPNFEIEDEDTWINFVPDFLNAPDFKEFVWAMSFARFVEQCKVKGFNHILKGIAKQYETDAVAAYQLMDNRGDAAHRLFLISRTSTFADTVKHTTSEIFERLANDQNKNGSWSWYDQKKDKTIDSVYLTALFGFSLFVKGDTDIARDTAIRAATFLKSKQLEDGAWKHDIIKTKDFELTCIVASLIKLSDPTWENLNKSKKWITEQQNSWGIWEDNSLGHPYNTVLALDAIELLEKGGKMTFEKEVIRRNIRTRVKDSEYLRCTDCGDRLILLDGQTIADAIQNKGGVIETKCNKCRIEYTITYSGKRRTIKSELTSE